MMGAGICPEEPVMGGIKVTLFPFFAERMGEEKRAMSDE
jgi:hypothetical protein